jgi:hypothetical protein
MMNIKFIFLLMAFVLFSGVAKADIPKPYNAFEINDGYFDQRDSLPEYYRPDTMNPLIMSLPEYSMYGPGFVCEKHQAPPVYRLPLQWGRNVGYREADWFNNRLNDNHLNQINFGGYYY